MEKFGGKVAVITGTSSGIGRATAKMFAKEGAKVIGIARREDLMLELEAEIKAEGGVFVPVIGDITKEENVDRVIETAVEKFGKIDVLVNDAETSDLLLKCDKISDEIWDDVMALNLTAPFKTSRKALSYMLKQSAGGCIVNVGSVASIRGGVGGVAYTASEHGIMGLTRSVAYGYAKKGIRCNLVMPGSVDTYLCSEECAATFDPEGLEINRVASGPMIRLAQPEEIANVILYAASDDASILNGAIIAADAGYVC